MAIPDDESRTPEFYEVQPEPEPPPSGISQWLLAVTLALAIAVAIAIGYTIHEQRAAGRLEAANGRLAAELSQAQNQMASLTSKVNALSAPKPVQPAPPPDETWTGETAPASKPAAQASGTQPIHIHRVRRHTTTSPWRRRLQAQLAAQQTRLAADEQALAKAQSDLSAQSASTQAGLSNLGGSIAKNHAQLVALERLGQRNYYEFDLTRSKQFSREGPISLDLRHADTKHQNYDVDLMVDDFKLSKKHINLYEPITLETDASPQPVELVVNRITKNEIHGYVSAPKNYEERAASRSLTQPANDDAATLTLQTAPVADSAVPQALASNHP